ncbi:MAG: anti-sigma factor [Aquihabitans sp.]
MNEHDDDTIDALAELRALAADVEMEPTTWAQPPAGLWERIAAEAGVPAVGTDTEFEADVGHVDDTPIAPVVPLRRSRRRTPWILGAVAAVVALLVGVAVFANRPVKTDVVASVALDPLGTAPPGSGNAKLIDDAGQYRLKVDTADLDPGEGFLEVWVIDAEVTKLVSLGPVRPDGTYDLPPGLDPEQFPVVDVSVEPLDGNPGHSGDSVLRGTLTF